LCFAWFIWEGLGWFVMMGNVAETPENKGIERKYKEKQALLRSACLMNLGGRGGLQPSL